MLEGGQFHFISFFIDTSTCSRAEFFPFFLSQIFFVSCLVIISSEKGTELWNMYNDTLCPACAHLVQLFTSHKKDSWDNKILKIGKVFLSKFKIVLGQVEVYVIAHFILLMCAICDLWLGDENLLNNFMRFEFLKQSNLTHSHDTLKLRFLARFSFFSSPCHSVVTDFVKFKLIKMKMNKRWKLVVAWSVTVLSFKVLFIAWTTAKLFA